MEAIEKKIKRAEPTLVVFEHVGQQDSSKVKHMLDDLRKEFAGNAVILTYDASYDGNVKEHFKLEEFPTYIMFNQGTELMRESGNKSLADLTDFVTRSIKQ